MSGRNSKSKQINKAKSKFIKIIKNMFILAHSKLNGTEEPFGKTTLNIYE